MIKKFLLSFIFALSLGLVIFSLIFFLQSSFSEFSLKRNISDSAFTTSVLLFAAAALRLLRGNGFFKPFSFFKEKIFCHSNLSYPEFCNQYSPKNKSSLHLFTAGIIFFITALIPLL